MTPEERAAYDQELLTGVRTTGNEIVIDVDGDDNHTDMCDMCGDSVVEESDTEMNDATKEGEKDTNAGGGDDPAANVHDEEEHDEDYFDELADYFDESGQDDKRATVVRSVNWTPRDVVKALDQWYEFKEKHGDNKKKFVREVMKAEDGWNKSKFAPGTLRRWLKREVEYRASAKADKGDRRRQGIKRTDVGRYPEMEYPLAAHVRQLRDNGIPVETWMLEFEAKMIFHKLKPHKYPCPDIDSDEDDAGLYPILFSPTWMRNFCKRHGFSFRTAGTNMNKKGATPKMMNDIQEFHTDCRAFQLSAMNDTSYGLTSPEYVYSHDQVPLELADSNKKTLDVRGVDEVYNAVSSDADMKRFCTLNLFVPMKTRDDGKNVSVPHLVFRGTFQDRKDWHDKEEQELWDDRVAVSFHPNAWVDAQTHMIGLEKVLGPVNSHLEEEESGMRGVIFEEYLSSHQTDAVFEFWKSQLANFEAPRFVPPRMTEIVQVVDRHIGIRYEKAVYMAFRKELMRRLSEARDMAGKSDGVTIEPLTPREKRIITTRAVGNCHERLLKTEACKRAFVATGTWLPISHIVRNENGKSVSSLFLRSHK